MELHNLIRRVSIRHFSLLLIVLSVFLFACASNNQTNNSTGGKPVTQISLSDEQKQRLEAAATDYVLTEKKWQKDEFRIEVKGVKNGENYAVVWAIFLEDEKTPVPGGGKSIELHIDLSNYKVIQELWFQ